jgi:hypothetical protein
MAQICGKGKCLCKEVAARKTRAHSDNGTKGQVTEGNRSEHTGLLSLKGASRCHM